MADYNLADRQIELQRLKAAENASNAAYDAQRSTLDSGPLPGGSIEDAMRSDLSNYIDTGTLSNIPSQLASAVSENLPSRDRMQNFFAGLQDAGAALQGRHGGALDALAQQRERAIEMQTRQQEQQQKLFQEKQQKRLDFMLKANEPTDPDVRKRMMKAGLQAGIITEQDHDVLSKVPTGKLKVWAPRIEKESPAIWQAYQNGDLPDAIINELVKQNEARDAKEFALSSIDSLEKKKSSGAITPTEEGMLNFYQSTYGPDIIKLKQDKEALQKAQRENVIGEAGKDSAIQAAQQAGPQAAANLQKTLGEVAAQGAVSPLFHSLSQPVRDVLASKGKTNPSSDDISQAVAQATAVNAGLDGTNDQLMAMGIDPRTASAEQRQAAKEAIFERAKELKRIESGEVLTQKINIERKAALQPARAFLDELKPTVDKIFTASGPLERLLKTPGSNVKIWLQTDPDAIAYQTLTNGFLAKLSRAAGEVGVLTEQDVQRAKALLPVFTPIPDTKQVAQRKLTDLNKLLDEIGNRNVTPPGKSNVINKLTPEAQGVLERLNKKATEQ